MSHAIRLTPLAIADLIALHRWVASQADGATANAYLDRIQHWSRRWPTSQTAEPRATIFHPACGRCPSSGG